MDKGGSAWCLQGLRQAHHQQGLAVGAVLGPVGHQLSPNSDALPGADAGADADAGGELVRPVGHIWSELFLPDMGATGSTPLVEEEYPYYYDQFYKEEGYYYQDLNYDEEGIPKTYKQGA